jgi:hypothetical protein
VCTKATLFGPEKDFLMKSTISIYSASWLCATALLVVNCGLGPSETTRVITITSPATGSKLLAGDTISVQWTPSVANPKVSYTYNITSSLWEQFATVIPVSSQEVKVALPTTWYSDSFQIKVEDNDGDHPSGISGRTAIKFIVITSPAKGQSFTVGQSVNVTWRVSPGISSIHVMLATDSLYFQEMLTRSVPWDSVLTWKIGSEPSGVIFAYPSDSCRIRISNYLEEMVCDTSGIFSVH